MHQSSPAEQEYEKLKEGFMATVSHELRTPLNGILGLAGALKQVESSDQKQKQLAVITNCAQSMLRLVTDIIDQHSVTTRNLRLTLVSENLDSLLLECVEYLRQAVDKRGKPIRKDAVQLRYESSKLPELEVDRTRLRKTVIALIDNALKFTSEGSVTVRTRTLSEGAVEIQIIDTGVGIESSAVDRIFKAFEQGEEDHLNRKFEGLGLGLSLANEVAMLHGGRISVASDLGKGSQFTLHLPKDTRIAYEAKLRLMNEQANRLSQTQTSADPLTLAAEAVKEFASGEALFVDPNVSTHLAIERMFRQTALKVTAVTSRNEALQYFRTHARPDAVIISETSDWRDLCKVIRTERSATIPIFIMVNSGALKLSKDAATLLTSGCVKEPVNVEEERTFFETVMSAVRQRFLVEAEFKRKARTDVMKQVLPELVCRKLAAGASEFCEKFESLTFVSVKVDAADIVKRMATPRLLAAVLTHAVDLFEDGAVETGLQVTGVSICSFSAVSDTAEKGMRFINEFMNQIETAHPEIIACFRAGVHTGPGINIVAGGRTQAPHFLSVATESDMILASLASSSLPGRIHLTKVTQEILVREFGETGIFNFQERGELDVAGDSLQTYILKKKTTEDLSHAKLSTAIGVTDLAASTQPGGGWISTDLCGAYIEPLEKLVEQLSGLLVDSNGGDSNDNPLVSRITELEQDLGILMASLDGKHGTSEGYRVIARIQTTLGRTLRDGQLLELQEEFDFVQRNLRFLLEDWRNVNQRMRRLHDQHISLQAEVCELRENAASSARNQQQSLADLLHADINRGDRVNSFSSRGFLSSTISQDPDLADAMSSASSLGQVWAGAVTGWVLPEMAVPIYNAPLEGPWKYSRLHFPRDAVFELTAFNPAAFREKTPNVRENFEALERLKLRLEEELSSQIPRNYFARFPTFGFDSTGYREDGVGVACDEELRDRVRGVLVDLGREFGQGAIYEFSKRSNGKTFRKTVACDSAFDASVADVEVASIDPPTDWSGGWKHRIWHAVDFYARDEL